MSNVLFILTGSIACYKACDAVSKLVQRGHQVRTVMTAAAREFVGTATLEALTRAPVATDLFAPGEALDHITLARWADLTIVCPATANTLNRLAAGLADDLAGSLLLAHEWTKPLLVAPAMNPAMWSHPATVASVERLRGWGVSFVSPGEGRTACGEVGEGRLAEPEEIVAAIESRLARSTRVLRVLITSGGTSEPIDGVRVLSNTSTGVTGAAIADFFTLHGHRVVLARASAALQPQLPCEEETFTSFADLDALLSRRLEEESFDAVIHAAAVSDFAIEAIEVDGRRIPPGEGKLQSGVAPILHLRRNPKLLDTLRQRSRNPKLYVVAFKLTRDATPEVIQAAVETIFATGAADFVVQNDLAQRTPGGAFPADLWRAGKGVIERCPDRDAIAPALERALLAIIPAS